jgi:hypothetical protein
LAGDHDVERGVSNDGLRYEQDGKMASVMRQHGEL